MSDLIRGVIASRLPALRELLWEWTAILERTARSWTDLDDCAWFYNERATLSILAGAVWRIGGIAFEEYYEQRHNGRPPGRLDLYFELGRRSFVAESKQCWTSASGGQGPYPIVSKALHEAAKQVKSYKSWGDERLAVAFAAARLGKEKKSSLEDHLQEWLTELKRVPHDCLAWSFPPEARAKQHDGKLYPGVAVVIRKVGKH